jgi:hypothetical protein
MSAEAYQEGLGYFIRRFHVSDYERDKRKSKGYLLQTGLPREIRKIRKKKEGIIYNDDAFAYEPEWKAVEESSFDGCAWDIDTRKGEPVSARGVAVEALTNGTVIIRGAPNATTVVLYREWKNDREVLFNALHKALLNPRTIVF